MALKHAMWIHGHSMQIQDPDRLSSINRFGQSIIINGKPGGNTWLHFAIPTPVIVDDKRLRAGSVMIRFRSGSADAFVNAVHVWDGENRIAVHENFSMNNTDWEWPRFDVPGDPEILWGVGISIHVAFGVESMSHVIEFSSAGCDFF